MTNSKKFLKKKINKSLKKKEKYLVKSVKNNKKNKSKKYKDKKNKSKKQKQNGGFSFNSLINNDFFWSVQDFGSNLMHTLNGTTIPASSNATLDQFKE